LNNDEDVADEIHAKSIDDNDDDEEDEIDAKSLDDLVRKHAIWVFPLHKKQS